MCMYTDTYRHMYIWNVIPGKTSFKQEIHKLSWMWKNKYGYQMKIFVTVTQHLTGIMNMFKDTFVCIISKVIGINNEKEICQPNRET